jgi:hypothetical protein
MIKDLELLIIDYPITKCKYEEDNCKEEIIAGGFFGSNLYQVDLFFIKNRNNIAKLFIYIKKNDKNWQKKQKELHNRANKWKRDGFMINWSREGHFLIDDMLNRRLELLKKKWKRFKKLLGTRGQAQDKLQLEKYLYETDAKKDRDMRKNETYNLCIYYQEAIDIIIEEIIAMEFTNESTLEKEIISKYEENIQNFLIMKNVKQEEKAEEKQQEVTQIFETKKLTRK